MELTPEQKNKISQLIVLVSALIAEIFASWLQSVVDRNIINKIEK